ncbi:hypothetical protein [Vibrio sp.]|uniref:hypothetical protein n=1 Tax=Vibrio sp. TaxID=678 RepID=UPI003AA9DC59
MASTLDGGSEYPIVYAVIEWLQGYVGKKHKIRPCANGTRILTGLLCCNIWNIYRLIGQVAISIR